MDLPPPWTLEIVLSLGAAPVERRRIARRVECGELLRIGEGRFVDRVAFDSLAAEGRHVVRMRALTAVSRGPMVFSHWSAATLHRLPVLRPRLDVLHLTTDDDASRHRRGASTHLFPLDAADIVEVGGLLCTSLARTVVDVAGADFVEGVMAADAMLFGGHPRAALEAAAAAVRSRRAARTTGEVVAFAHPGAESAAESRTRVTAYRLGVEVPHLQHRVALDGGRSAFLDEYFPEADAGLEVDGDTKYLDRSMAPDGAAAAVLVEKRREDDVRTRVRALGRIGWAQSGDPVLLRPVLGRIGVHPLRARPPFTAWCATAQAAGPRPRTAVRGRL